MEKRFELDRLTVSVSDTREEMGRCGAEHLAGLIRRTAEEQEAVNVVFASAPSQMDVLNALLARDDIPWDRIRAFHMDEYVGLPADAPQSFGNYLRVRFFEKKPFAAVYYMDGNAPDPEAECARYSALLQQYPPDIAVAGIGTNGHLAFNDPGLAKFDDPVLVKVNPALDDVCIQQQVDDGWFKTREDVPRSALTLTIPAIVGAPHVMAIVPTREKAAILRRFAEGPVGEDCPSTILRRHPDAMLFLDRDAASLLTY